MAATTATAPIDLTDEIVVETIPMSYDEYLAWCELEEGNRGEWVDGEVIPFMTTSDRHQRILTYLMGLFAVYLDLRRVGRLYSQTFEMRSREGAAREPDILILLDEHMDRLENVRVRGAADLAVEIVSPDSVSRDRKVKLREYADVGVPEYWVVDPREGKERVDLYRFDPRGEYAVIEPDERGRLRSTVLPGLWVDPDWLTVEELPSVVRLGMEMAGAGDADRPEGA